MSFKRADRSTAKAKQTRIRQQAWIRPIGLLVFFQLLVPGFFQLPAQNENPAAWLDQGQRLAESGQLPEALVLFDRFKQTAPQDPRPYIYAGRALVQQGRKEDALNELQQVLALKLVDPDLALLCADTFQLGGWDKEAIQVLAPFEDDPELTAEGLWLLSDLLYDEHLDADSQRVLEKFARRRPDDTRKDLRLGEIYLLAEDYPAALAAFRKAVLNDPENAAAYYGLGRAVWLVEGTEDCKKPLLRAIELEPDNPNFLQTLAIICDRLGQTEEAIHYLEQATKIPTAPPQIFFDLGNVYRKTGNNARTREILNEYRQRFTAAEAEKNRAQLIEQLLNQGAQQLEAGNIPAAIASLERVLDADPENWQAHNNLAKIYLSSPRRFLALPHLEAMLKIEPDNSEGSFLAAFYHYHQKNIPQALSYAERSKQLLPGNPELRNLLGNIYLSLGRREDALEEYRAALSLNPENAVFKLNYESVARQF